ncbi:MAG: hypothetical protein MUW56_21600 [Chryseobacterium sp.]|uniref:hypothetical protein n=1 Tax=Chryseobacterium sp. TaxID=1871047 RepID=UPI0025C5B2B3|nr:hypothetical protein [Chryseobacterium sp.]MCJ7936150.1 hypothetical protein [Chryseobacterium sp.]
MTQFENSDLQVLTSKTRADKALDLRKSGHIIVLMHELDVFDEIKEKLLQKIL